MKFDIEETIKKIKKPWESVDLIKFDNKILRIALFEGKYPKGEHQHEYEEVFVVYRGKVTMSIKDEDFELSEGQGIVVPKGAKHSAFAPISSFVLYIDQD